MEELKQFLNSLSSKEQCEFAKKCGTSIGYLRKAISRKTIFRPELCVRIELESKNKVTRKHLVPNWQECWPELINN